MGAKIAVIGLHQIGLSIGLALKEYSEKITVVGFDPDPAQNAKAAKMDIFKRIEPDGAALLKETNLIVLTVPADEVHDMLTSIARWIEPGACVLDSSMMLHHMDEFASQTLPQENGFITTAPVLNPAYLEESGAALDEPHADLFKNGALVICSGSKTRPGVIKTAADFADLIGAHPYFADLDEAAAIFTNVELLPKLMAAVMINSAVANPIHNDGHRLADKAFLRTTGAVENLDEFENYGKTLLQNRDFALQSIDRMIAGLQRVKNLIAENDGDAIKDFFALARSSRTGWQEYKKSLDWSTPTGVPEGEKHGVVGHTPWFGNFGKKKQG